jgi:PAS domain S-box-containing protein
MGAEHEHGKGAGNWTQSDHALRASELSYRRLFEAAKDGILILELETGRITDVNPFLLQLLGFSKDDVLGKTVGELSPFKDIASNKIMLECLQRHGYVRYEDLPLKTRDGRDIDVEFVCNVYPAGDRQVIQCNVRDITARKASEAHLTMLNTCVGHLNDIILVTEADPIDLPGPRIVFVNAAFERISGYAPAEAIGQSPRILQGPKTDRRILAEIHQALAKGQPIKRELLNYRKDGTEYWMDVDNVPVLNSAGQRTHFAAIERDITESKRLKESLNLFRTLMDRSLDAIEVLDPVTGTFLDVNETACRRLGYSRKEMLSLRMPDVLEQRNQPFPFQATMEAMRKTGFRTIETRHRRKDGSTFPVEINAQYVELGRPYLLAVVRDITERKEAEKQLLWKTAFFEAQVNSSLDGTVVVDRDGKMVLQNQRMIELWHPPQEIFDELDHRKRMEWVAGQVVNPREFSEKVAYLYDHPNEVSRDELELLNGRHFDRYTAPVIGRDQTYFGRIWAYRDITERKQTEAKQRASEERYRTLFDYAPDGIVIANPGGTYIDGNASICRMLGYSRDELIGCSAADIVSECEISKIEGALNDIKAESFHHQEWQFRRKDGSSFPAEVIVTPMPDGNLLAMIRDASERRRSEEQIAEQATFLDKAQDAIFVRDLEGQMVFWNKGAERMYGWARGEVLGRKMDELLYTSDKELAEAYRLTTSQGDWHGELHHFTKDGTELIIESRWTLIRDKEGLPKSVLAINTDITAKKMIEAQFMRAQRMESIGTLAGGIAHDLNNILAPILMSIELLKATATDPAAANILKTIEVSARRGADIVRQVLSFARGVEGERIEVQLKHLID